MTITRSGAAAAKMSDLDEIKSMIQQVSSDLSAKLERLEVSITDRIRAVVQEQINTVVNEITEKFASLEARVTAVENKPISVVDDRQCNFVVSGLAENEDENTVEKVNNLLHQELNLNDIRVSSADRKSKYNGNDCGVIVAKCANLDDKNKVMEAKSLLRDSAHFRHISIFPDKPKWQRVHEANIRLVVKTLGTDKMFVKGSRVCLKDDENQWQQGGHHRGGRVGNTRGQGGRGGRDGGRGRGNQAQGAPGRGGQGRGDQGRGAQGQVQG